MRFLVTGGRGMLGQDLVKVLAAHGHESVAIDIDELDLTDAPAVDAYLANSGPLDVVVNCAAFTAVDDAEAKEELALAVNGHAARNVAEAARRVGARVVQISTDYVFDGSASAPYAEDAPVSPTSAYGRTKAAGEEAVRRAHPDGHLVVRTAWLYGEHGPCFPRTILRLVQERGSVDVVDDQVGQPTWTVDVAETVVGLTEASAPPGTYHATSEGLTSWFGFAQAVVTAAGLEADRVRPTDSASFVRPAPRPAYSALGHEALDRAGVRRVGPWDERWQQAYASVLTGML